MTVSADIPLHPVLRVRTAERPQPLETPESEWHRFWCWPKEPRKESARWVMDVRTFLLDWKNRSRDVDTFPFNREIEDSAFTLHYVDVYDFLVGFEELVIDDREAVEDDFTKLLRHIALFIGMPVSFASGKCLPEPEEAVTQKVRELENDRLKDAVMLKGEIVLEPFGFDGFFPLEVPFSLPKGAWLAAYMTDLPYQKIRRCIRWSIEFSLFEKPEETDPNKLPDVERFIEWVREGRAIHHMLKAEFGSDPVPLDESYLDDMLSALKKHGKTDDFRKLEEFANTPDPTTELRPRKKERPKPPASHADTGNHSDARSPAEMPNTPHHARELTPDYMMNPEDLRKVFRLMPKDLGPYYASMFLNYLDVIRVLYGSSGIAEQLIDTPPWPDLYTAGAQAENCFRAEDEFLQAAEGFDISLFQGNELTDLMTRVRDQGIYPKKRKGRTDMLHLMLLLLNNLTDYAGEQASKDEDPEVRLKTALLRKMLPISEIDSLLAKWNDAHDLWEFFQLDSDYKCWRLVQLKMPKAAVPGNVLLERLDALPEKERKIMAFLIGVIFGEIVRHAGSPGERRHLVTLYYRKESHVERITTQTEETAKVLQDVLHCVDDETKMASEHVASLAKLLEKRSFRPLKTALTLLYKALCAACIAQEEWLFLKYRCEGESPSSPYVSIRIAAELIGVERHFQELDDPLPKGNPPATIRMLRDKLSEDDLCLLATLLCDVETTCRFLVGTAAASCNFEFASEGMPAQTFAERSNPVFEVARLLYDTVSAPENFADIFRITPEVELCDEMKDALARCEDGLLRLPREENREFFAGLEALRRLLSSALELPKPELLFVTSRGRSTADNEVNEAFMHIFSMRLALMILTGALPQKDAEIRFQPSYPVSGKHMLN